MKVLKFGGSSVATADRMDAVADIVRRSRRETKVAVVVSAMGGVTDSLAGAAATARHRLEDAEPLIAALEERHAPRR